jgi:hypothetical protein
MRSMSTLQVLVDQFRAFPPGTRARALFFLRTGVMDATKNDLIQAKLDQWVCRLEKSGGPGLRGAVLRALGEAA